MKKLPVFLALAAAAALCGCGGNRTPAFDGASAYRFLVEQCEMGPRYPGSEGHRLLRRYIVDRLKGSGASVSLQPFEAVLTSGDTLSLVNIIGNYEKDAGRRILLGAHYDTRPRADRNGSVENRGKPILGANDGASGVAVLLEIARLLGENPPPLGVDVVFFDGEDFGEQGASRDYILGSSYFVNRLKGYRPGAVIIVDMVGEAGAEIKMEGYSEAASGPLLEEIFAIADDLKIDSFRRDRGESLIDDHVPFIGVGLPAVVLIDFEYQYWHTLEDTPDKCSGESLAAVGKVLLEYLWRK